MPRSSRSAPVAEPAGSRGAGLVGALWLVTCACVAPPTEAETAERATLALRDAEPSEDDAVVALVRAPVACGRVPALHCTGTVVAPRAVLTAAHCVLGSSLPRLWVAAGAELAARARFHEVVELLAHPGYDAATKVNDVALVLLAEPILDVAPLPLGGKALDSSDVGRRLRVVGYGHPGDDPIDGVRRRGTTVVSSADAQWIETNPGPSLPCDGDSGGPLLARNADGTERVVGVTSWGDPACLHYAGSTQLASHLAFLGAGLDRARALPPSVESMTIVCDGAAATPDAATSPAAPPRRLPEGCNAGATAHPLGCAALPLLLAALRRRRAASRRSSAASVR